MTDEIEIKGEKSKIEVSNVEDIEVQGDKNVIKVEGEDKDIKIKGDDNIISIKEDEDKKKINLKRFKNSFGFLKDKKIVGILIAIIFLIILILSVSIRFSNMNLLEDSTTGKAIPLALDPYYFLRIAETKLQPGPMPECDSFRILKGVCNEWTTEILPDSTILIYNIGKMIKDDITIQYAHIINPVIFFILGLVVFFFLTYVLTNSKIAGLLGCGFLAFIPSYLYRTMAGFADHESIGMFAFFLLLLGFGVSMKYLGKETGKKQWYKILGFGLLTGFLSSLTIASWGGIAKFVFMIIPLAVLIFWFIQRKERKLSKLRIILLYYISWIIFTILVTPLISGYSMADVINRNLLTSTGILTLVALGFIVVNYLIILLNKKEIIKINRKKEIIYSFGILIFLGLLFLVFTGKLSILYNIPGRILSPFGEGRVGQTVAENQAPTLEQWKQQTGPIFFWIFILGLFLIGKEISKNISESKKRKWIFLLLWIAMILGVIFSSHSSLNSFNFLKKFLYFGSVLLFLGYSAWLYTKEEEIKIKPELIIIASWMIFMLIGARGAIRLFFVVAPFEVFAVSIVPVKLFEYAKKNKDDLIKMILWIMFIVVVVALLFNLSGFYYSSQSQAKNTAPSAHVQWQNAMSWVRENTDKDSIFLHWWDYGYWVEYLGERATLSDGGHFQGAKRNHMIGRYILTTTKPETALSFMKSNNVTHLLIDPTDIGKYSAYSRIGSGPKMEDRFSWISTMVSDPSQIMETRNGSVRMYQGGTMLDEDIFYENNESEIFLPGKKAGIGGIQIEIKDNQIKQPIGVFLYNNQRYDIPLRYAYYDGQILDFKNGIEATAYLFPRMIQSNQGVQIDNMGGLLYLSPRTMHSLVAELYLMDDPFNKYPAIKLAHKELDPVVNSIKMQGTDIGDFIYYKGLRGPIKIWNTKDIPENIISHEELSQRDPYGDEWEYGILDGLAFKE